MAVRTDTAESWALPDVDAAERARVTPYWNPYVAGIGLGLVLLAAFVIMGRGLGSSGAFTSLVAFLSSRVAPAYTSSRGFLAEYVGDGSVHPLKAWLVFEVIGVFAGAFISGMLAGRISVGVERGPRVRPGVRLAVAFGGGVFTAVGAALARGCTSGQALTGGALLNLGSWIFMLSIFGGAYLLAYFVRWQWK